MTTMNFGGPKRKTGLTDKKGIIIVIKLKTPIHPENRDVTVFLLWKKMNWHIRFHTRKPNPFITFNS
ncbi:hypothetical protein GCM10009001_27750 [Virgibacillus siamensis]|uniref:Uncharacterized protein n=1 Tax=Virgibacillus siamensis TaxID=480071 RepID=A0ABN1GCX4_9BACI